jgi:hypothetical protein
MKKRLLAACLATTLLTACAVVPVGPPGRERMMVVPFLPPLVVLETEPYYFYSGFHYFYRDSHWFYSRSRSGPWVDLPRDHYPREVRFRGRGGRSRHE